MPGISEHDIADGAERQLLLEDEERHPFNSGYGFPTDWDKAGLWS
jgi:hypothetical protein